VGVIIDSCWVQRSGGSAIGLGRAFPAECHDDRKATASKVPEKRVTLLCCGEMSNPGAIPKRLTERGYRVTRHSLRDILLPADQDVILSWTKTGHSLQI
jgi:hypothetical protein